MQQRQSHESLLRWLIDYLKNMGLDVALANLEGYNKPPVIKRHSPDIMAKDPESGLIYIGMVKQCSSLEEKLTQEQFEDFSKRLMKNSDQQVRVPLVIAVPKDCEGKVKEMFRRLEIPWKDNIHVLGV